MKRSYDNRRSAVTEILNRHLPDDEARSEIFKFVTITGKIASLEVLKLIPGGVSAYNIFSRSWREYENDRKKREASQARDKPESSSGKNEDEPENSTKKEEEEEEETENSTKKEEEAEKESSGGKARRLR
ncbi:hypothetical protein L1049_012504 [Liquidambar formosana]|uniref:Uncharacterized protein n=1 Tax=Liquidambar formosana TaxID=63359 RepID=A0AAP0N6F1_LIQFO